MATSSVQDEQDDPRILVADDDQDFLEVLQIWLNDYDSPEIITVTNGEDALDALDATISAFLCDRRMPKLSGPEVIERMARTGYNTPTIVVSAYSPDSHLDEDDVELYLQKPLDRDELFEAIDDILTG